MTESLSDKTSNAILVYIQQNDLKEGDKLPNEYNLAKELNVGRSTLREAVKSLVSRNILEVRHGSGTYLSENMGQVEDPLGFQFVDDTYKLTKDLFYFRYLLEPEVAFLAAENRTEEQVLELKKIRKQIELCIHEDDSEHINLDVEFHSLISRMSGNIAMGHIVPVINESIALYNTYYTTDKVKDETIESHRDIERAIINQNANQAKMAMQLHLLNNQRNLQQ